MKFNNINNNDNNNDNNNNENISYDELDDWFDQNEYDENTIQIISRSQNNDNDLDSKNLENNHSDTCKSIYSDNEENFDLDIEPTDKQMFIEDIIKKNQVKLSSNELIQDESSVAYFIQMMLESVTKIKLQENGTLKLNEEKINSIIEYLEWISKTCDILAKRIKQTTINYAPDKIPSITRSSYNFCAAFTQCKKYYKKNEDPICEEHHYVHSLLKYDIDSVIAFLKYITKNKLSLSDEDSNNLYLSIKTICFVTRHMAREISFIEYLTKNNSEEYHRNNPIEFNKRKSNKKWNNKDSGNQLYQKNKYKHNESQVRSKTNIDHGNNNNKTKKNVNKSSSTKNNVFKSNMDMTNRYSLLSNY
ncbi:hypothetical protein QJ854_gp260 [Moumouvirus goulette]|uniref:Uncharacterized protein n=1 Tax=Moumouvirus goulette TaxID=1247379 RepID=M1PXM6_9VIRU|nr:hypothetical protein QJ854_gp260 [Moumouvirus goulette]AGF85522.1 hypothetical protein glt_00717 [Moumouvirus goulette]